MKHCVGRFRLAFPAPMLAEASMLVVLSVQRGEGTEACISSAQLQRGVEKRLKRKVFVDANQASLRLAVIFTRKGADSEARIELASIDGTPRGTRSLVTASHCSTLDDSLALSVALLVDQPPEPEPEPETAAPAPVAAGEALPATRALPAAPPRATTPPTTITIPADVAAARAPWHAHWGAVAAAAWGGLPGIRPALALYAKLVPPHFLPILLQGEGFWPSTAERSDSSGARFHLFRAGLALCPALYESPALSSSLCFGQKLGWLTVEGYGFDHDRKEGRLSYALSGGAEGMLRLFAPVSLRGYWGVEVPLARDRFASGGRDAVLLFEPQIIAISGEIGLEAALW
jgi:hypothetical protein